MSTERDEGRRGEREFAQRFCDLGGVRVSGPSVVGALRRLFQRQSPAPAQATHFRDLGAARAGEPGASTERVDEITRLLDDIGRPVTEEALRVYAEMEDEVFDTIARDLRAAYHKARHPLQVDAERRADQGRGTA